jgi:hypothetical protein
MEDNGVGTPASPSALIQKLALPNTAYITNVYDSVARLLSTKLNNSSHTTLNSHAYLNNVANQSTRPPWNSAAQRPLSVPGCNGRNEPNSVSFD